MKCVRGGDEFKNARGFGAVRRQGGRGGTKRRLLEADREGRVHSHGLVLIFCRTMNTLTCALTRCVLPSRHKLKYKILKNGKPIVN